ncbi:MAG TPA: T9SS type A sorting domain-containing protein, partial [Flavobacteriales bacterium]|nr:T9SS type A sorting domain-containing protein [Flavobacteriales bacterium]
PAANAQDGAVDPSFNPVDVGYGNGDAGLYGMDIRSVVLHTDQKILVGGAFGIFDGSGSRNLTRLLQNGRVDPSFSFTPTTSAVNVLLVQPADGKILVGGMFYQDLGAPHNHIMRIHPDGSVDTGFNPGIGPDYDVNCMALQADGKIIIGGAFTNINGTTRSRIARLNANGTLDTSFNPTAAPTGEVYSVAVDGNGKILVGGDFSPIVGTTHSSIARFEPDGSLDPTFNAGTGARTGTTGSGDVNCITVLPDARILIGGYFSRYNGMLRNNIASLLPDGSLDPDFTVGTGSSARVHTMARQQDGYILVAGDFDTYDGANRRDLVRIHPSGAVDPTLVSGASYLGTIHTLAIQADGRILIGGDFVSYGDLGRYRMTRILANGTWDSSFSPGTGANLTVHSIAPLNDGSLLLGGGFTLYNGAVARRLARLEPDGTLDLDFGPNDLGCNNQVKRILVQPDGRILIAGMFTSCFGEDRWGVARLLADGAVDPSFDPGFGISLVEDMVLQPDGRIIVCGNFTNVNGIPRNGIARLLPDGGLDMGFDPGSGPTGGFLPTIYALALGPDGTVLIGGAFTTINGVSRNNIARLNPDGSVDLTFDPGSGTNFRVLCMTVQPDERIFIGGEFNQVNGVQRKRLARLMADGSLDQNFDTSDGASSAVNTCLLQADGKLVIGGHFGHYGGVAHENVARVNPNGSLDQSFDAGPGTSSLGVWALAFQTGGALIVGGDFFAVGGLGRNRIARLFNAPVGIPEQPESARMALFPNPADDRFIISLGDDFAGSALEFTLLDVAGHVVMRDRSAAGGATVDVSGIAPGSYVVEVRCASEVFSRSIMID